MVIVPQNDGVLIKLVYGTYDCSLQYFHKNAEIFEIEGIRETPYLTYLSISESIPSFLLVVASGALSET